MRAIPVVRKDTERVASFPARAELSSAVRTQDETLPSTVGESAAACLILGHEVTARPTNILSDSWIEADDNKHSSLQGNPEKNEAPWKVSLSWYVAACVLASRRMARATIDGDVSIMTKMPKRYQEKKAQGVGGFSRLNSRRPFYTVHPARVKPMRMRDN